MISPAGLPCVSPTERDDRDQYAALDNGTWLMRSLIAAAREVETWPAWKRDSTWAMKPGPRGSNGRPLEESVGRIEGGGDLPSSVNARRPSASEGFGRGEIGVSAEQPSDLDASHPSPLSADFRDVWAYAWQHLRPLGIPEYISTGDAQPVRLSGL